MRLDWQRDGVEIARGLISRAQTQALADEVAGASLTIPRCGIRNAQLRFAGIEALASDPSVQAKVAGYLGGMPSLVRAIFFDKTAQANWLVPWHQDRTLAVAQKVEHGGVRALVGKGR